MNKQLPSVKTMVRAFRMKDPAFEGIFFTGVKTTGVFCRVGCRARPAKEQNMEFFQTVNDAARAGYRPCKMCKPLENPGMPEMIKELMELVESRAEKRWTEDDLAARGIDASTARRQFQRHCGMSFAAWQRARRMGAAMEKLSRGKRVIVAQAEAGFASASGFREAVEKMTGKNASAAKGMRVLMAGRIATPLGVMACVVSEQGVVLLDFVDRKGLAGAIRRLTARKSSAAEAVIVPGKHKYLTMMERELGEYFAGTRQEFSVPVVLRGSPFELAAWGFLRGIGYGQTRAYGQQAKALGRPGAARAMGRANGRNYIAIVVPCHRVIGADGALTGYGGGVARKRWLLDHEAKVLAARGQ